MSLFRVPEMHCDACIRSLTAAVRSLDPAALVQADRQNHRVEVHATAPDDAVAEAMRDAGSTWRLWRSPRWIAPGKPRALTST